MTLRETVARFPRNQDDRLGFSTMRKGCLSRSRAADDFSGVGVPFVLRLKHSLRRTRSRCQGGCSASWQDGVQPK